MIIFAPEAYVKRLFLTSLVDFNTVIIKDEAFFCNIPVYIDTFDSSNPPPQYHLGTYILPYQLCGLAPTASHCVHSVT